MVSRKVTRIRSDVVVKGGRTCVFPPWSDSGKLICRMPVSSCERHRSAYPVRASARSFSKHYCLNTPVRPVSTGKASVSSYAMDADASPGDFVRREPSLYALCSIISLRRRCAAKVVESNTRLCLQALLSFTVAPVVRHHSGDGHFVADFPT